jgi:glycosyltransferase involved in cell wall biosynthesis
MREPEVSVVMGVYNGAAALDATLRSVLDQQGCEFEFVVVDDGSTDATPRLLDEWAARESRLRVIHQPNTGLTGALIRGCAEARGEFIARQDCGDRSLPGRLAAQVAALRGDPPCVMVAGAARFLAPGGEMLFVVTRPGHQLEEGLSNLALGQLHGPPHHGATMFRRAAYERAGGYRPNFRVAQDIDLWLRLAELGTLAGQADLVYEAQLDASSITATRRDEQVRMASLAIDCALARRAGRSDAPLLEAAAAVRPSLRRRPPNGPLARAQFLYFVGSCLRERDPRAARRYFWASFRTHPLLVKSLVRVALG